MNYLFEKIIAKEFYTEHEAMAFIRAMDENSLNDYQIGGILSCIQTRGIQLSELIGFRKALLELATPLSIDGEGAIDLCGTGGDGKDTFNISTTSAFVLAAMGKKVIKHGNYGVSSSCGSSNVLEALGYNFTNDEGVLNRELDKKNICFLHAPLFHPTMKKIAPLRRALGIPTIFNSLGPLVNPVQPDLQLTGTYSIDLAMMYRHVLKEERKDFKIVHGMDGYDEISLTDSAKVFGKYTEMSISASSFEKHKVTQHEIKSATTVEGSAEIIRMILNGKGTMQQNKVIAANVATALSMYEPNQSLKDHFDFALEFITSGACKNQLNFN